MLLPERPNIYIYFFFQLIERRWAWKEVESLYLWYEVYLLVLLNDSSYKTKDAACQEQIDERRWQRQRARWVNERRRTVMVTRGDIAAMNLLLHPPGDTCWLTHSRKEWDSQEWRQIHKCIQTYLFTLSSKQVEAFAVPALMSLASTWVSGRCCHIDPNRCFVFAAELKRPSVVGLVTPSGHKAYYAYC